MSMRFFILLIRKPENNYISKKQDSKINNMIEVIIQILYSNKILSKKIL